MQSWWQSSAKLWEGGRGRRITRKWSAEELCSEELFVTHHSTPLLRAPFFSHLLPSQLSLFFFFFKCTDPSLPHSSFTVSILQTPSFPARHINIIWLLEKVRKSLLKVGRHFFTCTAVNYHSFSWPKLRRTRWPHIKTLLHLPWILEILLISGNSNLLYMYWPLLILLKPTAIRQRFSFVFNHPLL